MGHGSLPFFESCCLIEHRPTVNGRGAALAEQPLALYVEFVRSGPLAGRSPAVPNCRVFDGL
jgi:hypothetical protein